MVIICLLKGGLGNQLFQYSAACYIQKKFGGYGYIDINSGFISDSKYKRYFALEHFNLNFTKINTFLSIHYLFIYFIRFIKRYPFIGQLLRSMVINDYNISNLINSRFCQYKLIILDGYFHSFILAEANHFSLINIHSYYTKFLFDPSIRDHILKKNSVCLHLRHYSNDTCISEESIKHFYVQSVAKVLANVENPFFYVFSDISNVDLSHLNLPLLQTKIIHSDKASHPISDFYLMSLCKYFIFAGSTFCYWAVYVSDENKKTVYASSLALKDKIQVDGLPYYPEHWSII